MSNVPGGYSDYRGVEYHLDIESLRYIFFILLFETGKRSTFKNIARNRLVHTSSLWDDDIQRFDPQHLTDGYRGGDNPYCTSTKKEGHAWFKVDLQNVYQIDHVLVYTGKSIIHEILILKRKCQVS